MTIVSSSYDCGPQSDIWTKIASIATNFVLYWTFHSQYQTDIYNAGVAVWSGLQTDVLSTPFPYPEAVNWTIQE
jgi:hypothetical protein